MQSYVERVRGLVAENKHLWKEMHEAGVVSYSYLRQFAAGRYENPGAITLESIERFIVDKAAA